MLPRPLAIENIPCPSFFNISEKIPLQDAMESLLAEMETAGGACAGDDCEATFEVTEV